MATDRGRQRRLAVDAHQQGGGGDPVWSQPAAGSLGVLMASAVAVAVSCLGQLGKSCPASGSERHFSQENNPKAG
jgi:hypothetical protein